MAVTILVPTYNMAAYLMSLAESLLEAGLLPQLTEVLFVDDGSVDATPQTLEALTQDPRYENKIRVLRLEPNRGRFTARYEGAKVVKSPWILFLDSRLHVQPGFALNLQRALKRNCATVGWVETNVHKNVYCLYWQRSHEFLFRQHYQIRQPLELTADNYDRFLKGTGVFACKTEHFLSVCEALESHDVRSDDTLLLREMLEFGPIFIDPQLKVDWEPRAELFSFLFRLFERGPGFVEYHVFTRPGRWAFAVLAALFALALWLGYALREPGHAFMLALLLIPVIALSGWPFAMDMRERLRILPLHLLVVLSFGLGVLYGLGVNILKSFKIQARPK